jgi:hypothetical protein
MVYLFEAGKDVAFSESAKEIFYHRAYNMPLLDSGVGRKGRVLFFNGCGRLTTAEYTRKCLPFVVRVKKIFP